MEDNTSISNDVLPNNTSDSINNANNNTNLNVSEYDSSSNQTNQTNVNDVSDNYQGDSSTIVQFLVYGTFVLFIITLYAIYTYKLYNYAWAFFSTYIFVYIRQFWIFAVVAVIFSSFKLVKWIEGCIAQIKLNKLYSKYPLKDPPTMDFFLNKVPKRRKVQGVYIQFMKLWYSIMIIIYVLAIIVIIIFIMLTCFIMGHMLSWMDYFWILR